MFLLLLLFLFPLVIGAIYALPFPQVIAVEAGDLLAYYGTVFGIIGSFVAYRREINKRNKERIRKLKPSFFIDVKLANEGKGIFQISINNHSEQTYSYLYFHDEFVSQIIREDCSFQVTYNKTIEEMKKIGNCFNIIEDVDIIDSDGYPKHIDLLCDDKDGNTWSCCYHKVMNGGKIYYYPRDFEIM